MFSELMAEEVPSRVTKSIGPTMVLTNMTRIMVDVIGSTGVGPIRCRKLGLVKGQLCFHWLLTRPDVQILTGPMKNSQIFFTVSKHLP